MLTGNGSSGGPIINLLNWNAMGIHKGAKGDNRFNLGTLIKSSIEEYNKLEKNQKLNINKGLFYNHKYSPKDFQ